MKDSRFSGPRCRYTQRVTLMLFCFIVSSTLTITAQFSDPCVVMDNGTGTATLPPSGCTFISPDEVFMIIDGLPPGTTIELQPRFSGFFCRTPPGAEPCIIEPGGVIPGGQREVFDAFMVFEARGTGELDGFNRILTLDLTVETHSGPRTPGDPEQSFPQEIFMLQGQLFGDPDFGLFQLSSGFGLGLPSPGMVTLTSLANGTFMVDSFFDVTYQITFEGAPGGGLDGLNGVTTGSARMEARGVRESRKCLENDNGTGTVTVPPQNCGFTSLDEKFNIIDGLPPGTIIEMDPFLYQFSCATQPCGQPGGMLGGEVEIFEADLQFHLEGTDSLADFRRTLRIPVSIETHSGPRAPGEPVQSFPTELFSLQGMLIGDPDFAFLQIASGTGNGLPSPGHTVLQSLGDGTYQVDSFFDITYQIDFEGAPGGALEGLSGTTQASVHLESRRGKTDAIAEDNGKGTATVPVEGSKYVSQNDDFQIIEGLPPGTTLQLEPSLNTYFCANPWCASAGGSLGGDIESFSSTLDLQLTGTGVLAGMTRTLQIPVNIETHSAPRSFAASYQPFDVSLHHMMGSIFGDPDFDELTIVAGSANGLPSPGFTTLVDLGNGSFQVDSFFDITYRIDFVGALGGQLEGMSGSTERAIRMEARDHEGAQEHNITIVKSVGSPHAQDFSFTGDLGGFSLDVDSDPTLGSFLVFNNLLPGTYTVTESPSPGFDLTNILCDDPDSGSAVDLALRQVTMDLDFGEAITSTFENTPCSVLAAVFNPPVAAQGLNPVSFEVIVACDTAPVTYDFNTNPTTPFLVFGSNTITLLPTPTVNITINVDVNDNSPANTTASAMFLVSDNPVYFDLNVDGCNNVKDLWALATDWRMGILQDPNSDGVINILDFLYINLDDPLSCGIDSP